MAKDRSGAAPARFRRWFGRLAVCAALGLIAWAGYAVWTYENNPLSALPDVEKGLQASTTQVETRDGRRTEHIVLNSDRLGDIGLTISFPDPLPPQKLPVLVILGGLGTGQQNIEYLKGLGNNILVGYDWPLPDPFPRMNSIAEQIGMAARIPDLLHRIIRIPAQVASAIDWAAGQPWADGTHISLIGFSLGSLVLPAIEDLTERSGSPVGWTIIAYGGASLGDDLGAALANSKRHRWYDGVLPPLLDLLLNPLQPTWHLPRLQSRFLVLEGQNDERFPEALRARLREAVPDPKQVIVIDGPHLGLDPSKLALLDRIVAMSEQWLIESGAVNAP